MNWANWAGLGLVRVAAVAIALASPIEAPISGEVNATEQIQTQAPEGVDEPSSPKRHQVTVNLVSPNDLKVKEGQRIKEGDVISDRTEQRQQLEARKKQLEIAIAQLSLPMSQIASLPEPNFEQEEVALKKAKVELDLTTKALKESPANLPFKQQWLNEDLRPEEIRRQAALKEQQIKAAIAVESAVARLSEAKTRYQQQQYQHSIELAAQQTNLQKQQEVASEISQRLTRIFLRNSDCQRPVYGATQKFQNDPNWQDLILFYEYFHGDNGVGIGASHQTGWTGLVAKLIQQFGEYEGQHPTSQLADNITQASASKHISVTTLT
jgi:multidrug efflux pump subunit AcrA (membrane-fusion protein)